MTSSNTPQDTEFKFISRLQAAKEKAEDFERHQRAGAGLETGDGSNHHKQQDAALKAKAGRERTGRAAASDSTLWFDLLERRISDLHGLIDNAEAGFATQYGEDWREQMAQDILDPDLIPQRRDGESMTDYRARVEQALIGELLNEDGTIRNQYRSHPKYGEWGKWAQWKHDQQQAQTLKDDMSDPALSDAERAAKIESFTQTATHDRLEQALLTTGDNSADRAMLNAAKEAIEDTLLNKDAIIGDDGFQP